MKVWLVPFPMAPIQHHNVSRTNFLLGLPTSTDFVYENDGLDRDSGEDRSRVFDEAFATLVSLFMNRPALTPAQAPPGRALEGLYDILFWSSAGMADWSRS